MNINENLNANPYEAEVPVVAELSRVTRVAFYGVWGDRYEPDHVYSGEGEDLNNRSVGELARYCRKGGLIGFSKYEMLRGKAKVGDKEVTISSDKFAESGVTFVNGVVITPEQAALEKARLRFSPPKVDLISDEDTAFVKVDNFYVFPFRPGIDSVVVDDRTA